MLVSDLHRPAPSAPRADPDDIDHHVEVEAQVAARTSTAATLFRDIHPEPEPEPEPTQLLPPPLRQPSWDAASHRSLSDEPFTTTTMSREFSAMVVAGASSAANPDVPGDADLHLALARVGDHEPPAAAETNPLAIVPGTGFPLPAPAPAPTPTNVEHVKKEEVEAKVAAWQAEEVAKINNKFKREEVVINGWESQQVDKATAWLSKIERKLEEERAKATEKARNDVAMARRKADERRASAEARRGTKTAKVLDLANFMKAVGRVPTKRSFFSF